MPITQQLGRYEILTELGRGGMGAVFRARDPKIDRTVAIKIIAVPEADSTSMEQYRQRFFREAQAAGRLSHPGIVTIHDVDEDPMTHTPFIVMEYAEGRTLAEFVAQSPEGRLAPATALDLVEQIALALDYAHGAGIVHRDIKPANVIVTPEGRAKIMDFGIAKIALKEATVTGHLMGTPAYMSPEQINGKPVDGRSDLFSLGVIAYWLLTGVKPFDGDTVTEICVQVATRDPQPVTELRPGLGTNHQAVLARALAKDPAQRYQNARELAADIRALRSGEPLSTSSHPDRERTVLVGGEPIKTTAHSSPVAENRLGSGSSRHRSWLRKRFVLASFAVAVLLIAGAALFSRGFAPHRPRPATLQLVGSYPFHNAEIYIWVDGELRYHDNLHDAASHSNNGGSLGLTMPVQAGRHTVRIQVNAPGRIYDHDTAIPGYFRAYTQKTLRVDFASRDLALRWE
jgi:serine/threonine protein kinase